VGVESGSSLFLFPSPPSLHCICACSSFDVFPSNSGWCTTLFCLADIAHPHSHTLAFPLPQVTSINSRSPRPPRYLLSFSHPLTFSSRAVEPPTTWFWYSLHLSPSYLIRSSPFNFDNLSILQPQTTPYLLPHSIDAIVSSHRRHHLLLVVTPCPKQGPGLSVPEFSLGVVVASLGLPRTFRFRLGGD
jgi:hypothetical protein